MTRARRALHVVKVGSATLRHGVDPQAAEQAGTGAGTGAGMHAGIHAEIAELVRRGSRVLVVAGGAEGIERHYAAAGREMPMLRLANGDVVRHSSPEEMGHIVTAYQRLTLPEVESGLAAHGLSVLAVTGSTGRLVTARANKPLRAVTEDGRSLVVRDHRVGSATAVARDRLLQLLDAFDVVCVSPPVADEDEGATSPLNVDADVLAAHLAVALDADHVRLVTGTRGLLTDPADPTSTVRDLLPGEGAAHAKGRMRQKVRAAEIALQGSADVAITGPHTMRDRSAWSRFWRTAPPSDDLALLTQTVGVPSVSRDEAELAEHLRTWCEARGIAAEVDAAGNLVATRGDGPRRLLLLGHLDTVPFTWPVEWRGDELHGRGSVDAKGCLVNFLEVLATAEVPADGQLRVVGAVEEEISSSKGAFHVRDHYPADTVVVGEPSGVGTLTLGYFGLLKFRIRVTVPAGHSAGMSAVAPADALVEVVSQLRSDVLKEAPDALSALIDVHVEPGRSGLSAVGILNFRVPPSADLDALVQRGTSLAADDVEVELLRATPGHAGPRTTPVVRAFSRAFSAAGIAPRFVVKRGTSDMNTLATTWEGVPMVAYGPGDSALDHTDHEHVLGSEVRTARAVLADAVAHWFRLTEVTS